MSVVNLHAGFLAAAAVLVRYFLAFVFLRAAAGKIGNAWQFRRAVLEYRLLPEPAAAVVVRLVPWLELAVALGLLVGVWPAGFGGVGAAVLGLFALAVAVNLIRGREIDCGCGGSAGAISWSRAARTGLYALLAGFSTVGHPVQAASAATTAALAVCGALLFVAVALAEEAYRSVTSWQRWRTEVRA